MLSSEYRLLRTFTSILVAVLALAALIPWLTSPPWPYQIVLSAVLLGMIPVALVARARLATAPRSSVLLLALALLSCCAVLLLSTGIANGSVAMVSFVIPIILAGVAGRRELALLVLLATGAIGLIYAADRAQWEVVGFSIPPEGANWIGIVVCFGLIAALIGGWVGTQMAMLRHAQAESEARAAELQRLTEHQETIIAERTNDLAEAIEMQSAQSRAASHDMSGPVQILFAYLAQARRRPPTDMGVFLDQIATQLGRLSALNRRLMMTASIQENSLRPQSEPVAVIPLVRSVVEEYRVLLTQSQPDAIAELITDLPDTLTISTDAYLLRGLLDNLFSNAIKAMDRRVAPAPYHLRVALTHDERDVCIAVIDNGVGIAPDMLNRIGHTIVRASTGPSNGLGLHLAVRIAAAMGIRFQISSDGLGLGATATLRIPSESHAR